MTTAQPNGPGMINMTTEQLTGPGSVDVTPDQPICYGAKNDEYATFKIPHTGSIKSVKLTYVSGRLDCNTDQNDYIWGCHNSPYSSGTDAVMLSITDTQNQIIVPKGQMNSRGFITVSGIDSRSNELILELDSTYEVQELNQELRVWYNQDLLDTGEYNNSGELCIYVTINYV